MEREIFMARENAEQAEERQIEYGGKVATDRGEEIR